MSHGPFRRVAAVWDLGGGAVAPSGSGARPTRGRPIGLRTRSSEPLLKRIAGWFRTMLGSLDEIAMIGVFVLFVFYGIQWLIMIFR